MNHLHNQQRASSEQRRHITHWYKPLCFIHYSTQIKLTNNLQHISQWCQCLDSKTNNDISFGCRTGTNGWTNGSEFIGSFWKFQLPANKKSRGLPRRAPENNLRILF